jgi:hypothetical protein
MPGDGDGDVVKVIPRARGVAVDHALKVTQSEQYRNTGKQPSPQLVRLLSRHLGKNGI